tara:strand:+ start:458 stop:724 length:267 start_codon:yes stop_codon:yes gene_type:complete
MKEIFISFITLCTMSFTIYFTNTNVKDGKDSISMSKSTATSKFNSGISIKDVGKVIIIEQKPHDATIIIDKEDLENIIVFLNNTNDSE